MVSFYWEDISWFGKILFFLSAKIIEVGGLQVKLQYQNPNEAKG